LKRSSLYADIQVIQLVLWKYGFTGCHVDGTCGGVVFGRLKYGAFLTIIHGDHFHVIERETSQVDHSVLCIAEFDAIVKYPDVVTTHATNIYGFQSSDATVVFNLNA